MNIRQITDNKKQYLDLLLLADPQEDMIDRYLDEGEMFVLEDGGEVRTVCVVQPGKNRQCELKNIATEPESQGKGYGRHRCDQPTVRRGLWICPDLWRRRQGVRAGADGRGGSENGSCPSSQQSVGSSFIFLLQVL